MRLVRLPLAALLLALFVWLGAGAQARPVTARARALTSAQSRYLADAVRGVHLARRYWGNRKFHWYNVLLKDPKPYPQAAIWDAVPLFESFDEIALASPTATNLAALTKFANHAEIYWDPVLKPGPGYVPYPGGRGTHTKTFFDDNSVWGLAFLDAYAATSNRRYLGDAERAMGFVIAHAWSPLGGVWWNTWHSACAATGPCRLKTVRHSEVLAMATDLAARLYEVTGTARYLQTALKYINWANHNLLKWDGSYAEQVSGVQLMPHDGEGTLVDAFTALCKAGASVPPSLYDFLPPNSFHRHPSDRRPVDPTSWCSWAESLASKTAYGVKIGPTVYDRYFPLNNGPQYDDYYIRGLLSLYSEDHENRWFSLATITANRILKNAVNSKGLFLKAWNGSTHIAKANPGMLRTHAGSVSVLAAVAAAPPPP
jgi:hypothetical protein